MPTIKTTSNETCFAPAGRDSTETIGQLHQLIRNDSVLELVTKTCPTPFVLLTDKRQVITANPVFCLMLGMTLDEVTGIRPGELMKCEYATEGPDGCGTGQHCRFCGAVRTVVESQQSSTQTSGHCHIRLQSGHTLNLNINASPITIAGHNFTSVFIQDMSDNVRRQILERTFFHDIINIVGGIAGLSGVLASEIHSHAEYANEIRVLEQSTRHLLEEIECHRDLVYAESGDLRLCLGSMETTTFLQELTQLYQGHDVAQGRMILLGEICQATISTDTRLLARVLGNMIKNALEATQVGGGVTVTCRDLGDEVVFAVHNDAVMPEEVRFQIFQKSFSTKGTGRGIGTHSMKLLGEEYLKGRVSFTSEEPRGTSVEFALPKTYNSDPSSTYNP